MSDKIASTDNRAKLDPELQSLMALLDDLENQYQQTTPQPISTTTSHAFKKTKKVVDCLDDLKVSQENIITSLDKKPRPLTRIAIASGIMLTVITSIFLFFNFDALSQNPTWHPAMKNLCALLLCDAPLPQALEKIKTTSLVIRPDPKRKKYLKLDAILYNQADFAQAFPDIQLEFTDHQQQIRHQHYFHAQDYRHGQLAKLTEMPSQKPIHIILSIPDPNIPILNYQLKFYGSLQSNIRRYDTTHAPLEGSVRN